MGRRLLADLQNSSVGDPRPAGDAGPPGSSTLPSKCVDSRGKSLLLRWPWTGFRFTLYPVASARRVALKPPGRGTLRPQPQLQLSLNPASLPRFPWRGLQTTSLPGTTPHPHLRACVFVSHTHTMEKVALLLESGRLECVVKNPAACGRLDLF